MVTQNPFQSRRMDFREQIAKSRQVMIPDGEMILQIIAVQISCFWYSWQYKYGFSVFLVALVWVWVWVWVCVCCL
jgi:hypothetical protein